MKSDVLLSIGMLFGAIVAASGVVRSSPSPDAVAWIDGAPIARADFEAALAPFTSRTEEIERHVLEKMIDERLIVRRGIAMGLAEREPRIRGELAQAVIDLVARDGPPASRADLLALYGADPAFFARSPEVVVRVHRAGAIDPTVPMGALSIAKLRDYVGPTAARATLTMRPGQTRAFGDVSLTLVDRVESWTPPFAQIEAEVAREHARRASEARLRAFLDGERARSRIEIAL